jgi:hypothetical protein
MYKKCKVCKAEKPVVQFHKSTTHLDGRRNECSTCTSAAKWLKKPKVKLLKFVSFSITKPSVKEIFCFKCNTRKPLTEFRKRSDSPSGIFYRCTLCVNGARDKVKKTQSDSDYYKNNADIIKLKVKQYRKDNPEKIAELSARNRATRKQQAPSWLTQDQKLEIRMIYAERKRVSKETGIPHHVDHIAPIKGETICGLHVPWNLRVITAEENHKKRNKLEDLNVTKNT